MSKRNLFVAGNWKMNQNFFDGMALVKQLVEAVPAPGVEVCIAPPYVHLHIAHHILLPHTNYVLAAQNCYEAYAGAFTGEISPLMLKSVGASYVILGHSERRNILGEDAGRIRAKLKLALASGLRVIWCCGEPESIRKAETHESFVLQQLKEEILDVLSKEEMEKVILAYEPVWAIGTGLTATPEQAQAMHACLRKALVDSYGTDTGEATRILYGGSCKPSNARAIFEQEDVDGGLVGGASLDVDSFKAIIEAAEAISTQTAEEA